MADQLEFVRTALSGAVGGLPRVARETGISYDTILRIKNGEGDPGYSKVRALAAYFGYVPMAADREAA